MNIYVDKKVSDIKKTKNSEEYSQSQLEKNKTQEQKDNSNSSKGNKN